jgi:DNA polymerase
MNERNRKLLARFVAQRMDMGETEWAVESSSVDRIIMGQSASRKKAGNVTTEPEKQADVVPSGACGQGDFDTDVLSARNTYDELYETVCNCKRCALGHTRNKFVFGGGNPDADVMFIGEAPGADEDAQGLPFVGRAGKLLTKMIEAIKMSRDEVYIGNILKCRPPGNRDPRPEEIEVCEPILIRQIEIIKPKVICALGRISGQTLLRTKSSLGALRGKVHDYHGVKLIVTYHPAALLRNPNWKTPAWDDLKFLRREYDGLEL